MTLQKVADIKLLLERVKAAPFSVFPKLKILAASDQWQTREVAATALVRIGKRQADAVLGLARRWAVSRDSNVRRAASESLRGIVKERPEAAFAVLELLCEDEELYVKKSVANVLRNASVKHPELVLRVCQRWAKSRNPHTRWIVKDGLRKLKDVRSEEVGVILASIKAPG